MADAILEDINSLISLSLLMPLFLLCHQYCAQAGVSSPQSFIPDKIVKSKKFSIRNKFILSTATNLRTIEMMDACRDNIVMRRFLLTLRVIFTFGLALCPNIINLAYSASAKNALYHRCYFLII